MPELHKEEMQGRFRLFQQQEKRKGMRGIWPVVRDIIEAAFIVIFAVAVLGLSIFCLASCFILTARMLFEL